ncbi:GntR family transcriptional regulator [Telmatospirillum siberiense]|uniref:GntR family transcriptional regulator n=1 Tax=Telmatospirillum siberiense TaxID=382514 RepID=A0A2N3PTQ4_9PROT|nr:GntR family transcriptional regulator [Telmatospirillum siberiense]PKU23773.1 GntR family transcriptional regulator [Telmatospirillum siberiense]
MYGDPQSYSSAQEEAYRFILAAIREGRYRPGDHLIAKDVAAELQLSRMPVREALARLAVEGLVTTRPNRGAVVTRLTADEISELFEIRAVLEGLALRLAIPSIDAGVISELNGFLDRMEQSDAGENGQWNHHHQAFHQYLSGLSRRPTLIRQINSLYATIDPYLRIWFHHAEKPRGATPPQRLLVEAIKKGDPAEAEAAMRAHVLRTAPSLVEFIKSQDGLCAPEKARKA